MKRIILYSLALISAYVLFSQNGVENLIINGDFESGGNLPTWYYQNSSDWENCNNWNNVDRGGVSANWTADWLGGASWPSEKWSDSHSGEMALGILSVDGGVEGAWQGLSSSVTEGDLVVVSFWYTRSNDAKVTYINNGVDLEIILCKNQPKIKSLGGLHWEDGVSQEIQELATIATPNDTEWHYYESSAILVEDDFSKFAIATFPTSGGNGQQYFAIDDIKVERINPCSYCPSSVGLLNIVDDNNVGNEGGSIINSSNSVVSNTAVWTAEDYISLQPGFTAQSGSDFIAQIGEVQDFCSNINRDHRGRVNYWYYFDPYSVGLGEHSHVTWYPFEYNEPDEFYLGVNYQKLQIYNRWGSLMYEQVESKAYPGFKKGDVSWNGKLNGEGEFLPGYNTYYAFVLTVRSCDGEEDIYSGSVAIMYNWLTAANRVNTANTGIVEAEAITPEQAELIRNGMANSDKKESDLLDDFTGIYPNPTTGIVNLPQVEPIQKVLVYDQKGAQIFEQSGALATMDLSSLQPGIYMVQLVKESGTDVQKIVIQR